MRHKIAITIDITPVIVMAIGAELFLGWYPQFGHAFALSEYSFPHSGHLIKAIFVSFFLKCKIHNDHAFNRNSINFW